MAQQNFDSEDIGLLVLAIFSSAVMVGIATVEAFGISMSDTITVASFDMSIAWFITVGAFVGTLVTNEGMSLDSTMLDQLDEKLEREYYLAVVVAGGLLVGWVLLPDTIASFFQSEDLWGVVYIAVHSAASIAIGWML